MKKDLAVLVLLVVLCVIVTALNPRFLSPDNLQNTARLIGAFGIFSLGLGLVIITGGIDLSVGSSFALLGVLLSMMLTEWHLPWPLAVLPIIAIAGVLGVVHGLLITRLRLQPFIVTLCGTNSISPSSDGSFFELDGIAAAVLGGCSLRGGEGSIIGILLGTTLLQVLQNLVNLLGIPSSLNFAVMGGVVGDQVLQRRAARVAAIP